MLTGDSISKDTRGSPTTTVSPARACICFTSPGDTRHDLDRWLARIHFGNWSPAPNAFTYLDEPCGDHDVEKTFAQIR